MTKLTYTLIGIAAAYILLNLGGGRLFEKAWAFHHWSTVGWWYLLLCAVVLAALYYLFLRREETWMSRLGSPSGLAILSGAAMALVVVFGFDSFLFGAGNVRVAQIAQTDDVIFRWFEFGTVGLAWLLFKVFIALGCSSNTAGFSAWQTLAYLSAAFTLVGLARIAHCLVEENSRRLSLFLLMLCGPSLMLLFGFVGPSPAIVAVTVWFAYRTLVHIRERSAASLAAVWAVLLIGLLMHASLVYLLPAVVFVSLATVKRLSVTLRWIVSLAVWAGLLTAFYVQTGGNLEWQRQFLMLSGKPPHSDYALFSARHLGDIIQIFLIFFPMVGLMKLLIVGRPAQSFRDSMTGSAMIMCLGGFTAMFVIDPVSSIVLDAPTLLAYLTPGAILLAVMIGLRTPSESSADKSRFYALLIAVAVALPMSYLPVYLSVYKAEPRVEQYLDHHEAYWLTGAPTLRDSYFILEDSDKASYWDLWHLRKSPDYMDYTGIVELAQGERPAFALRSLNNLIARMPYWDDPRALYVSIQSSLKRFGLAKPQMDTAMMLAPFDKVNRINQYRYYRDVGDVPRALTLAEEAHDLFPSDNEILIDIMLYQYLSGSFTEAGELADHVLAADSFAAYPYLIQGFILERQGHLQLALDALNRFLYLAPESDDTLVAVQKRDLLERSLNPVVDSAVPVSP